MRPSVLVVDDDELISELLEETLSAAGYDVTLALDGYEALAKTSEALPDLIVSDVNMPNLDGFRFVERLRHDDATRAIPLIFLTSRGSTEDLGRGLGLGADDYLPKPFEVSELLARVKAKLERRPVPADLLPRDSRTGLLSERALAEELDRELLRGSSAWVVQVELVELDTVRERFGHRAEDAVARQAAEVIRSGVDPLDVVARAGDGGFAVLVLEPEGAAVQARLDALSTRLVEHPFTVGGERVNLTPAIGYAPLEAGVGGDRLLARALLGRRKSALELDLRAARFEPAMEAAPPPSRFARLRKAFEPLRLPAQLLIAQGLMLLLPFAGYMALDRAGYDITGEMYIVVVVALLVTAAVLWIEGFSALLPVRSPRAGENPPPPATAVIAAYMPNEAVTIVETVEHFLSLSYRGGLQVILAYNTPRDLPVEDRLREIAARDGRFLPLRVAGSTSKAQNVNAALAHATGEVIAMFDADHHPQPGSFERAWRWLDNGSDLVQGRCVVRNAGASRVARTIAVEFESIYGLSHPGRARLHDFGLFGGSNGFWRAEVLRRIRMRADMLTEDLDAGVRLVIGGGRIAVDPRLVSRELAPTTLRALWNQRLRWSQGWFQVTARHLVPSLRSPHLSVRQKLGFVYLMLWREAYPWVALQMLPIIAFWAQKHGLGQLDWLVPVFVMTTAFTLTSGPVQVLFTWRLAHPDLRSGRWFLSYLVTSTLFYTEFKNVIGRVGPLKQIMRERQWKVTPREHAPDPGGDDAGLAAGAES